MGRILPGSATTTEATRRAIRNSEASLRALAARCGINRKTLAKWRNRTSVADLPTGPKDAKSTVLTAGEEAIIVAFRRHTLLPLDDCLHALQPTVRPVAAIGSRHLPNAPDPVIAAPLAARATTSRAAPRSRATRPPRRSSRPVLWATSTLILLRFRRLKANCISSWPSTAPPSSLTSRCTKRPGRWLPPRCLTQSDRRCALPRPHRADR